MKRSPQITSDAKPKNPPSKSESTKLKEMQKAYGILPKDMPKSSSKLSSTTKSVKSVGGSESSTRQGKVGIGPSAASPQKLRNSVGATAKATTSTGASSKLKESSSRKSLPPGSNNVKPSSKIIAASRANYAEKYGSTQSIKSKTSGGDQTSLGRTRAGHTVTSGSNSNNSPYKEKAIPAKASPIKTPSVKSNSSTTSRLSSQKPPTAFYDSEAPSEVAPEDYDEEFEEDYESDFEVANSTEEEEESEEASKISVVIPEKKEMEPEVDLSIEEEYDKSSSIREFEKLEKLIEIEEDCARPSSVKIINNESHGSGEPSNSGANIGSALSDSEKGEDDDEESNSSESVLVPAKQDAFPTMTGFSLNSSRPPTQQYEFSRAQRKSSSVRIRSVDPNAVTKVESKAPGPESGKRKMNRLNRGRIIQGMVKLDRIAVDIFHVAPYQYERFMAVFSGTDRLQVSTQTDQDKVEESAQTEPVEATSKWTQKPPTWSTTSSSCDIRIVRQEALGVGSDDIAEDLNTTDQKISKQFDFLKNWENLSKFIIRASKKILYVLEAEERIKLPSNPGNKGSLETIKMNRGLSVLNKLAMHTLVGDGEFVACASGEKYQDQSGDSKNTNGNKKHTSKNLITLWSLKEPSMPLYFLRVWGYVSTLKLHMIGRMVISGNKDGSLNVWNLEESLCYHSQYQDQAIRTPSVNTSCMTPTHILPVVGLEMFSETKNTFSIISVDKEGQLITWSCLRSTDTLSDISLSQHSSAWSTIHISVRHQIQLAEITKDHLQVTSFFAFWDADTATTGFYLGTFNGYVAKGQVIVESNNKATASIEKYEERIDSNPKITCVDISKSLNILVMGCEDGRCRLFEMSRKKLVLSLGGRQEPIAVKWSGRRASVLYVALRDSLLIWDLLISDMNPWKTIHLKDIQDFVLYSPPHKEYLVIISGKDLIVSTPAEEVRPLNSRDFSRIHSYFALLC